jgi:hypothetical protein
VGWSCFIAIRPLSDVKFRVESGRASMKPALVYAVPRKA